MRGVLSDGELFRSSRPDYIETLIAAMCHPACPAGLFRSSRPDYIETGFLFHFRDFDPPLFRSSRPDYIETVVPGDRLHSSDLIVPVFQAGLH